MNYVGSKTRIASQIIRVIMDNYRPNYIELFCGGCNVARHLPTNQFNITLNDISTELISLLQISQSGWRPPLERPTKDEWYRLLKGNDPAMRGYAQFLFTYRSRQSYYAIDENSKIHTTYKDNVLAFNKTISQLLANKTIQFTNHSCFDFSFTDYPPNETIIYCDPPYENTGHDYDLSADNKFNHKDFWQLMRELQDKGYLTLTSEIQAPKDFTPIVERKLTHIINSNNYKRITERLFTYSKYLDKVKYNRQYSLFGKDF